MNDLEPYPPGIGAHLLMCAVLGQSHLLSSNWPKLDLENYPHLPTAEVALTRAADYQVLLAQEAQ